MSIEQQLATTLSALVSGRIYPLTAPDSPVTPYIVYHNIANTPENTLADGVPINNSRIQVDCYDKTYSAVKTLAASVISSMSVAPFTNIATLNQDIYEAEVKLFRVQQDFSIWY
jgi:hypothetical protein